LGRLDPERQFLNTESQRFNKEKVDRGIQGRVPRPPNAQYRNCETNGNNNC